MEVNGVQLICPTTNLGRGANDGAYYPVGLLTLAKALGDSFPGIGVWIDDQHHRDITIRENCEVVGIQVASTLCHANALKIAEQAKAAGKIVVFGGPHATAVPDQIMQKRPTVDCLIRGNGEAPLVFLVRALNGNLPMSEVPSLSWCCDGEVVHNSISTEPWSYEDYLPLPLECLSSGIEKYWEVYHNRINSDIDAAFLVFTHFGCGYRARRIQYLPNDIDPAVCQPGEIPRFCSFCSLHGPSIVRTPDDILAEVRYYLDLYNLKPGSRVTLKCYGDNIGPQKVFVAELAEAIEQCPWWNDYQLEWTFYCQSNYMTSSLVRNLERIGTKYVFIGFDSANDRLQRLNGLGTNCRSHERAVDLCQKHGIKIQAASVLGIIGETPDTVREDYAFYKDLVERGAVERLNSAVIFVMPGTPMFHMLATKEPWIKDLDVLPTNQIRELWIKYFCPEVTLDFLREWADKIDQLYLLSPHASMGFESTALKNEQSKC